MNTPITKTCSNCGLVCLKNDSAKHFHRDRTKSDGYSNWCKGCKIKASRAYYRENSDWIIPRNRAYVLEHQEEYRRYAQERYYANHKANLERFRAYYRRKVAEDPGWLHRLYLRRKAKKVN